MKRHVIIGGGLAGHRAALELRRLAPDDSIEIYSAETDLPYDRPPLSKTVLTETSAVSPLPKTLEYEKLNINFKGGTRIDKIDAKAKTLKTELGDTFDYDTLLLATGSRNRLLPKELAGNNPLHYLRTAADALALRAALHPGANVLIIGGGFIGLEVAAAARSLHCNVYVIETADRILKRALPPEVSESITHLHQSHGVEIITNATLTSLQSDGGKVIARLNNRELIVDVVVVGIGVIPNCELAEVAGISVDNGIIVDRSCKTSVEGVFAAGEVTRHPTSLANGTRRLECWQIANLQPLTAAATMTGVEATYDEPPWFWTDQYDCNLQIIGLADRVVKTQKKGDMSTHNWTLVGLDKDNFPVMGIAMNTGRDISIIKRAIKKGQALPDNFFDVALKRPQ